MPVDAATWDEVPDLSALATALTGRPKTAADLVGETLARRGPRAGEVTPTATRDLLVQRFVARRSDPAAGGRADQPDPLARLAPALDRLSPLQRAVLVLSHRERITLAEMSGILDRPVASIDRSLTEAVRLLDTEPTDIAAALDQLGWQAPEPDDVRAALHRHLRSRRRRRQRIAGLAAAVVGLLLVAVAVPVLIIPRLPNYVRQDQEWGLGFAVTPPPGWRESGRLLEPGADVSVLTRSGSGDDICQVVVHTPTQPPDPVTFYREVTVRGRPGGFSRPPDAEGQTELSWTYAPGATAVVVCDGLTDPEPVMLQTARQLRFRSATFRLPFGLSEMPTGYAVQFVGYQADVSTAVLAPVGTQDWPLVIEVPADVPAGRGRPVTVNGEPARIYQDAGTVAVCREIQQRSVCVSADLSEDVSASLRPGAPAAAATRVLGALRFATDLDDRSTWLDGRVALPH